MSHFRHPCWNPNTSDDAISDNSHRRWIAFRRGVPLPERHRRCNHVSPQCHSRATAALPEAARHRITLPAFFCFFSRCPSALPLPGFPSRRRLTCLSSPLRAGRGQVSFLTLNHPQPRPFTWHAEAADGSLNHRLPLRNSGKVKGGKPPALPVPFRSHPAIDRRPRAPRLWPLLLTCRKAVMVTAGT